MPVITLPYSAHHNLIDQQRDACMAGDLDLCIRSFVYEISTRESIVCESPWGGERLPNPDVIRSMALRAAYLRDHGYICSSDLVRFYETLHRVSWHATRNARRWAWLDHWAYQSCEDAMWSLWTGYLFAVPITRHDLDA